MTLCQGHVFLEFSKFTHLYSLIEVNLVIVCRGITIAKGVTSWMLSNNDTLQKQE